MKLRLTANVEDLNEDFLFQLDGSLDRESFKSASPQGVWSLLGHVYRR